MPVKEITVDAPPPVVLDVLADPTSYEEWVVVNKEVRDHDRTWPAPGSGTLVRMEEHPAGGPAKLISPVFDPLIKLRNAETLRRLKRLAESRYRSRATRG